MNSATQSFLGRYRLVKVLGQGAMGVVYEAVDTRLNRAVAIKTVLRSHMADETTANEYATRFEREAQAAARLSHPHVVTVFDFGEHEDISYIVMEFIRGRELNQAFEAGEKFPLPEAIRIMCELLQALDYAHQQGIVHRDIKPANVMLDGADRVKLTDFGVARVANANQDRTMPGTLVGTPSYMSPEQILGLAVGSRADIFAAGVILYQFLTGKRPFTGGGPFGVQRKIVQDDPTPPSQANPEIPKGFDLIIARALAKQPENRYENAAAFAADLERIGATLPRAVPRIELDLPVDGSAGTPASAPSMRADRSTPPTPVRDKGQPGADPLTLITAVPFGSTASGLPQIPGSDDPADDPEATVIMFRPTAPDGGATQPPGFRPPAPQGPASATFPVERAGTPAPGPGAQSAAPRAVPVTPRPPPPAPPAPPRAPPTSTMPDPATTTARPAAVAPGTRSAAPRPGLPSRPPARRGLLPLAAGAGVAVLVLTAWLLLARPWAGPVAPAVDPTPPAVTPLSTPPAPTPGPTPPAVETTSGRPDSRPSEGGAVTPARSPTPSSSTSPPTLPTPRQAAPAARPQTTPPPAPTTRPAATPATPRATSPRPAAPRAAQPAPREEPRNDALASRCSDLLQRMQLGEPLTPEQTTYFQSRCTR